MLLKSELISKLLKAQSPEGLAVTPEPDLKELESAGSASIDLRLGCWFNSLRRTSTARFSVYEKESSGPGEFSLARTHYVPFGKDFILHPHAFVLGVTLEWVRIPKDLAGYVIGKSSWGRHGLIIATATGVHPGFTGCLTLELTNVGEIPIEVKPGTRLCQLFLHQVAVGGDKIDESRFIGRRQPVLGTLTLDETAKKLAYAKP